MAGNGSGTKIVISGDLLKWVLPALLTGGLAFGGQQVRVNQAQGQAEAYQWRAEECIAIWKALEEERDGGMH